MPDQDEKMESENTEKPISAENETAPEPLELPHGAGVTEGTSELSKIVQESAERIQNSKIQEPKIKRGRGRPRKDGTIRAPSDQGLESSVTPPAPQPPPDISKYLESPLISISNIPAARYRIPELRLTQEEAKGCAQSIQNVLNAFIPDQTVMSPKAAAVLGAFLAFGTVAFSKIQIYNQKIAEIQAHIAEQDQEIINHGVNPPAGPVHAANYFAKNHAQSTI